MILLCIAKLIRYLYEEKTRPGWIIRNTEILLYIYAFFVATGIIIEFTNPTIEMDLASLNIIRLIPIMIVHRFAQVSILIGLGHILRRILPVIEKEKGLQG